MRKYLIVLISLVLILASGYAARAQTGARVEIVYIETGSFPSISALMDVYDAQDGIVTGLQRENIIVLEDGQARPVSEIIELQPGVQLVVAVNPGPPFTVRDGQGVSRYEKVAQALSAWAGTRPADDRDNLSLVTTTGPLLVHGTVSDWLTSFTAFQPDAQTATSILQALAFAMDVVGNPLPEPGMKRAILFITPHLDDQNAVAELEAVAGHAALAGIRIYVWLIDSPTYFLHFSATAFKALALQTGGGYFAFSETEAFPDPETDFAPLRHVYSLKYDSQLTTSGNHALALQVQVGGVQLVSSESAFDLDVQPPNPIIISPPLQIARQSSQDKPFDVEALIPTEQLIEIIVEFPDGHPRPLVRTALFVDGLPVAENTSEPYDEFAWDLSGYITSGEHTLQVEAVDALGLRKASIGVPVTITIVRPPTGTVALLARNRIVLTIGAILLAGIILALILFSGGKQRLKALTVRRRARKLYEDPVTQPVEIHSETSTQKKKVSTRLPKIHRSKQVTASAYLVRLTPDGQPATDNPIPLLGSEITFGTNPVQATYVLDDASISPLHARLRQSEDGVFTLFDQGSVAGTWINYEPVSPDGRRLEQDDVVHFGQLSYRFKMHNAPTPTEPRIYREKPIE